MQSSRSATNLFDPGLAGFAHRGLQHGAASIENSIAAFAAALEHGAGIECDLRLTRFTRFGRALREALDDHRGSCGVMTFDPRLARWLKTNAPQILRGLVLRDRLSSIRRWGAMTMADPQFLAIDRTALGQAWVARARDRMPVYSWTIRTAAERIAATPLVDALIWEADGRPRS